MSIGWDLHDIFHKHVLSLFLNDFWDEIHITLPIFDLFLMDGEELIYALLLKIIELNEKNILAISSPDDLFMYLSDPMVKECIKNYSLRKLL